MRLIYAAAFAAIPVLASAQVSTVQPNHAPAILLASASAPAAPAPLSDMQPSGTPVNLVVRQAASIDGDAAAGVRQTDTAVVSESAAPQLIHAVKADFTPQQIAARSFASVELTVDANGLPQNISVLSASNSDVAARTLAAVSQYRFTPARQNFLPVAANISIKLQIKSE
jgi:hypothetical protein